MKMAKEYKINVDGYEIVYGPLVEQSRFTDEEWDAIYLTLEKSCKDASKYSTTWT